MATRIRFQHEGLRNYLAEATLLPAAPAPGLNPRRPLQRPTPGVAGPLHPDVVAGAQADECADPVRAVAAVLLEERGTAATWGGRRRPCGAGAALLGDAAPARAAAMTKQSGTGALVKVLTVEQVNARLERGRR